MTMPLVLLAICAIGLGFLGTPYWPWLQRALDPHFETEAGGYGLMLGSILLVALGLGVGAALYLRRPRTSDTAPDPLQVTAPGLFAALAARLGCDEFYAATVFRANAALATLADLLDRWVWDGAVRLIALLGQFTGTVNREADEGGLNAGFNATSEKIRSAGQLYSRAQTGEAHGYLRSLTVAFVVIVLLMVLGGVM